MCVCFLYVNMYAPHACTYVFVYLDGFSLVYIEHVPASLPFYA